jgi:hypothetical protein
MPLVEAGTATGVGRAGAPPVRVLTCIVGNWCNLCARTPTGLFLASHAVRGVAPFPSLSRDPVRSLFLAP